MRPWVIAIGEKDRFNILFEKSYPMRGGSFPKEHPCSDDPKPTVQAAMRMKPPGSDEWTDVPGEQPESDTALGKFRARGYWASCFPEGDGICIRALHGQSVKQLAQDATECFGRTVTVLQL